MEDSFDNIDYSEFQSVPTSRPRAMGRTDLNAGYTPEDSTLSKAWKRFSDKPFGSFRGNKPKKDSYSNVPSPGPEKGGNSFIQLNIEVRK